MHLVIGRGNVQIELVQPVLTDHHAFAGGVVLPQHIECCHIAIVGQQSLFDHVVFGNRRHVIRAAVAVLHNVCKNAVLNGAGGAAVVVFKTVVGNIRKILSRQQQIEILRCGRGVHAQEGDVDAGAAHPLGNDLVFGEILNKRGDTGVQPHQELILRGVRGNGKLIVHVFGTFGFFGRSYLCDGSFHRNRSRFLCRCFPRGRSCLRSLRRSLCVRYGCSRSAAACKHSEQHYKSQQ